MASLCSKMVVKDELSKLGIQYISLELGVVELENPISTEQRQLLKENIMIYGLDLLDDKKDILVEKIKNTIIEIIHYSEAIPKVSHSIFLSRKLGYDYTYLSNIFTEVKGITIQQYIIIIKIEKVKELILHNELNLSEIAYKMHYSSASHLSKQFKKITGVTPSIFKDLKMNRADNLENL
ncbi:helix-turn-helix domain-containing protein [Cyclobacterium jeungdonense]|uniref:AraC family transcriptional regulator n=1 Tax=Cyclobacterium jeungdonense TaxID=708087 RepID=A0ABT8C8S9_9BACT|nr:AraC family transcriptional regulator [Cyclobacterium jeungdonense]MDN3688537.1 AraC family transcriptional regulator [Cyclobacterium jeungdonense]